ncbi:MAG TPA: CYTH and CHAD domain-containing protein [Gaiellales bacterium]|nr:CYTH and CHAD domain-containing protein [Gaiellales bacterium]
MAVYELERERKLEVADGFLLPELPGERLRTVTLVSAYHDTPDRRLAAAGITLRRRTRSGRSVRWQLKLPAEGGRFEIELAGRGIEAPEEAVEVLAAHLRGEPLGLVATLRTRRLGRRVFRGDVAVADVFHDVVTVDEDAAVQPRLDEVEIELLPAGEERDMRRLAKVLRRAGAIDGDTRPKVFRVLDLAAAGGAASAADGSPAERLAAMLAAHVRAMLGADPAVRLDLGSESLHDLRVATRRMRALLRAARPGLDEPWAEGLRTELGWLAGETNDGRDLDVLVEEFEPRVERLGDPDTESGRRLMEGLTAGRSAARERVLAALASPRYFALVDRLVAEAAHPKLAGSELDLGALVSSEYRRMRKTAWRAGREPDNAAMHKLRIAGKRVRYAAELAALPGDRKGQAFIRAAKDLQDVLGAHQDAVVAEERIRALAVGAGSGVALVAGRLVEQEVRRRADARSELPDALRSLAGTAKRWALIA